MMRRHSRLFYKCTGCSKAFESKNAIYEHRESSHPENSGGFEADFTLLYRANFLKSPANLFSSREAFENKIVDLTKKWDRRFMFKCHSCEAFFPDTELLSDHNPLWCQMRRYNKPHSDSEASKLFPAKSAAKLVDKEKAFDCHLEKLKALCPKKCQHCVEIFSMLRTHFESHFASEKDNQEEFGQSTEDTVPDEVPEIKRKTRSESKSKKRVTRSSSIGDGGRTEKDVSPSKTQKRTKVQNESLSVLKSEKEVEIKKEPPSHSIHESANGGSPKVPAPPQQVFAKKGKGKHSKKPEPFVESLGLDIPSERKLLAINHLNKTALSLGSSVVADDIKAAAAGNKNKGYSCKLCDFNTDNSISFQAHILIHKPHHYGNSFQCKECGVSFASEPSWRTHLLLLHRIKKPDPGDYCTDLKVASVETRPPEDSSEASKDKDKAEASNDEDRLVIDEGGTTFKSRKNVCTVCRSAFSSPMELKRHFRGHGMAFLKSSSPKAKRVKKC